MALTSTASRTVGVPPPGPQGFRPSPLATVALVLGWALLLLGERILDLPLLTLLGLVCLTAALGVRIYLAATGRPDRRRASVAMAVLALSSFLAYLAALATTQLGRALAGAKPPKAGEFDAFGVVLTVVWLVLMLASLAATILAELALAGQHRAERVESRRVLAAVAGGVTLAIVATYGALFTFAAGRLDVKADFSYFRTARPGESTRKIVQSLQDPLKVTAFFPDLNDVGQEVAQYLRDLGSSNAGMDVQVLDPALYPEDAKAANLTPKAGKGTVVLAYGDMRQSFDLELELNKAKSKLKTLDGDFQATLLKVIRTKRTAYVTVGHGELNTITDPKEGRTAKDFKKIIEAQNYSVKDLGFGQGLGSEVPQDASMVIVLGPRQPFRPEELEALRQYAERGGRLLLALEGEGDADNAALADLVGIAWKAGVLCNDKYHAIARRNDADRALVGTDRYSSHPSVSTLNKTHEPVYFSTASAVDKPEGDDDSYKIDFVLRSMPGTWLDLNANFTFDKDSDEKQGNYNLAAAVTRSVAVPDDAEADASDEMRAIVVGDGDAFADGAFVLTVNGQRVYSGNVRLLDDSIRWLGGEESFVGSIETTEDLPIEHTKDSDRTWFYGCIVGAPLLVGGLGFWLSRRSRRERGRRPPPADRGPAAAPTDDEEDGDEGANEDDHEGANEDDGDDEPGDAVDETAADERSHGDETGKSEDEDEAEDRSK